MTLPTSEQPHLSVTVFGHPTFTITLDSLRITDTRSLHNDTDYVSLTVLLRSAIDPGTPQTVVKYIGNVNNGTTFLGLALEDLHIDPSQTLIFNYLVINYGTGHNVADLITNDLKYEGGALAKLGLVTGGTQIGRDLLSGIGLLKAAGWWLKEQMGALAGDPSCDGFVAAEQVILNYKDLLSKTASGAYQQESPHPGNDSPWGCGRNSMYYVDWHISRKSSIPIGPINPGPVVLK